MKLRLLAAASILLLIVEPSAARADSLAAVRLTLPPCSVLPFDSVKLGELLDVELRASGVGQLQASSSIAESASTAISVSLDAECRPDAEHVELRVVDPSGAAATRALPLADVPVELRPRAIAITIVEVIRATHAQAPAETAQPARTEPSASPSADATTPEAPLLAPPRAVTTAADEPVRREAVGVEGVRVAVEMAVNGSAFPSRDTALLGPSAAIAFQGDLLRASGGAHALFGQASVAAGTVDVGWAGGYVGVGLAGGGSLRPLVEPRLYAGYGWASGSPTREGVDGRTADRFIVAATLAAGVRSALLTQWDLLADVEVGHALRGMTFLSDDDRVAGLSLMLLAARVGLAFRP